ncbi:MAG TPA: hypothetical protein VD793_05190 [Gemmatimonadales bacterium]|nr:hypothetical protein [Gemmatimonadales bacterium]
MAEPAPIAFSLLGRRLSAEGVGPDLARWLRAHWEYPDTGAAAAPYQIVIRSRDQPPPAGSGSPQQVTVPNGSLTLHRSGNAWRYARGESGVELCLLDQGCGITQWGWERAPEPGEFHVALYVMIAEGLRASGLVPLHAAVAARQGCATAWLGVSGSGKSSTLLRAARAGWEPVAEDLVWLEPGAGRAHGWDRAVRVWPATLNRFFPDLGGAPAPDGKLLIPYQALGPARPRVARLERLVLLAREESGPSRWERVNGAEVTRALWEAAGVGLAPHGRDAVSRCVAQLVRRLPASRLVLGDGEPTLEPPGLS